jgi:hypothetical protein
MERHNDVSGVAVAGDELIRFTEDDRAVLREASALLEAAANLDFPASTRRRMWPSLQAASQDSQAARQRAFLQRTTTS